MTDAPLFPGYEPPPPGPDLSPDQRRTARQYDDVRCGVHPLTRGPLHPLASRHRDPSSPKADPFTCGSCLYRQHLGSRSRTYAKCMHPGHLDAEQYERLGPPRATHSAATDIRAWWPACPDYSPGDPTLGPDAARHLPEEE